MSEEERKLFTKAMEKLLASLQAVTGNTRIMRYDLDFAHGLVIMDFDYSSDLNVWRTTINQNISGDSPMAALKDCFDSAYRAIMY